MIQYGYLFMKRRHAIIFFFFVKKAHPVGHCELNILDFSTVCIV